ncbi:hypothetical protein M427DRAFT_56839 [Gonapodya prolifera JEL478]|uniref:MYND-type domain-containing protein n=1 Tax=Gonapodya prolifera (strain JEL478) TaxID=1344416 RepID=A0A139AEF6_GONPJ|nr:hypothetical protein M427DRAFT_56839 [Gonapodya prolifera JEL478]|eukprot:KXS15206.1 hypothetical protein M427DRAFT_56839 [Gonapodya prolifera JEL478]
MPSMKHCSGCKRIKYCSTDCHKVDWKYHKAYCGEDKMPDPAMTVLGAGWTLEIHRGLRVYTDAVWYRLGPEVVERVFIRNRDLLLKHLEILTELV